MNTMPQLFFGLLKDEISLYEAFFSQSMYAHGSLTVSQTLLYKNPVSSRHSIWKILNNKCLTESVKKNTQTFLSHILTQIT